MPVHNSRKYRGARDGQAANVRVGEKGGGEAMFCDSSHDSDVACALALVRCIATANDLCVG